MHGACSGLVKNMALKRHDDTIGLALVTPPNWCLRLILFSLQPAWTIVDGLESVRWAFKWAGYGDDATTETVVAPFFQLVRQRST